MIEAPALRHGGVFLFLTEFFLIKFAHIDIILAIKHPRAEKLYISLLRYETGKFQRNAG